MMWWLLLACGGDVDATLTELASDNPVVREAALIDARGLPDEAIVARLIELLDDPDASVRLRAVEALDAIGDASAVLPLTGRLSDPSEDVVRASVTALGRLGDPAATAPLIASLQQEPRPDVLWALGQLGDRSAVPVLAEQRNAADRWIRHNATEALRELD